MYAAVAVRTQRFPFSEIRVPHFPLAVQTEKQKECERAAGLGSYVRGMVAFAVLI